MMSAAMIVLVTGTLAAATIDVQRRKIPNALTAAMAIAAIALNVHDAVALLLVLAAMAGSFALGTLAFSAGWFGGGDVKLITAACGLVGVPGCAWLVLSILIAGAVLALAHAVVQRRLGAVIRNTAALVLTGAVPETRTLLPYGVAIAGGSAAYAFSTLLPSIRLPV